MTASANSLMGVVNGEPVHLHEWLQSLRIHRRLRPLLLETANRKRIVRAARSAGLTVSTLELQEAADRFRRQHGLQSAQSAQRWLKREGLSLDDFEAGLEEDLLVGQFREHLAQEQLPRQFATRTERYARARLRHIVAASEGQARELLARLTDDGHDFSALAREHSQHVSRHTGGQLGVVLRADLPGSVATLIFAARPGTVVGPVLTTQGYELFLVEELLPAELNPATRAHIRDELFQAWLRQPAPTAPHSVNGQSQP